MAKGMLLTIKESTIKVINQNETDDISLTDMTSGFAEGSCLIGKWMTNKNTLEYLGVWKNNHTQNFNYPEFGIIKSDAGVNRFVLSIGQ